MHEVDQLPEADETFWQFVIRMLEWWGPALLVSTVVSIAIIVLLLKRGRGPMVVAGLLLAVHLPFFVGWCGGLYRLFAFHQDLITSGAGPSGLTWLHRRAEVAWRIAWALLVPLAGTLITMPIYATAIVGSFVWGTRDEEPSPGNNEKASQTG